MYIACLDTESTSTGRFNEILELAIYSARGELILNSLYKPKRNRRWPHSEKVHGISPLMVQDKPHFQDKIRKIQKIFDRSQMILGFALDNDVRILEQSGITGLVPEKCLDVREMFWAVYTDELNMDFYHVPSLIKCAEFCGYVWEEGSAHSAAADAKATLYCYEYLMRKFLRKYNLAEPPEMTERMTDEQIYLGWNYLREMVAAELHRRAVEKAKGWLYLISTPEGILLISRRKQMVSRRDEVVDNDDSKVDEQEPENKVLAGIELADSVKGYEEFTTRFHDKLLPRPPGGKYYYKLDEADIESFKAYTNTFEG